MAKLADTRDICMESKSPSGQSALVLVFENGRPAGVWIVPIGAVAIVLAAMVMAHSAAWSIPASGGGVIACLLLAFMFSLIASRRWIAEIDLKARTLRISRRSFGRWTKTSVPSTNAIRLGRIEYETDGYLSYGVYVELTDGTRHAIPPKDSTLQEAGRVASQLSDLTEIPRPDTRF